MALITTHILIKNNRNQIEQTLESLKELDCDILIGDLGSTDGTIDICKKNKHKIFPLSSSKRYGTKQTFLK